MNDQSTTGVPGCPMCKGTGSWTMRRIGTAGMPDIDTAVQCHCVTSGKPVKMVDDRQNDHATPTPRTDAVGNAHTELHHDDWYAMCNHARTLERELAAANERIAELQQEAIGWRSTNAHQHAAELRLMGEKRELREQLAAAQAREQGLREALEHIESWTGENVTRKKCRAAISMPTDTTALDAVRAEERERAAILCETELAANDGISCAEAIRAMGNKGV